MADESNVSVSDLVREIKGLTIDFKKSLNPPANPWDQEVEFQRQNLRRHIIQVIFKYPSSIHAVKLETTLWIDTSHAVIARYRDLISKLDNKVNKNPSADQRRGNGRFGRGEEVPFWSGLILRLVKTFELTAATKAIDALSLSATDPADLASPQKVAGSRTSLVPSDSPMAEEISEDIKDKKLLFLQKSLISLGDLARYREQYNEGGGRPWPGNEAQTDRGRGTPVNLPALEYYRQAKLLLPDEGNPSNQLAILSLYGGDSFAAVMHYYRALCVKHAFPTSRENLHKTLQKVFDAYRKSSEVLSDPVEALQRDVLILHALWQLKPSSSKISELSTNVISSFMTLISSRSLSPHLITGIFIMSVGALWTVNPTTPPSPDTHKDLSPLEPEPWVETTIVTHILGLIRALSKTGTSELKEAMSTLNRDPAGGVVDSLAIFITATFRRTLPALHIASAWLKSNLEYLHGLADKGIVSLVLVFIFHLYMAHFPRISFREVAEPYHRFGGGVEFRGFIPLALTPSKMVTKTDNLVDESTVHPNEEHLTRIRTMLLDARYLASFDETPLIYAEGKFRLRPVTPLDGGSLDPGSEYVDNDFVLPTKQSDGVPFMSREEDADDDSATVSTDDPVGLAMKATLGENDDDEDEMEDERILYPQRTSTSPMALPQTTTAFPPPLSTGGSPSRTAKPGTTAEDLLSRVLGGVPSAQARARTSSDPLRSFSASTSMPATPLVSHPFISSTSTMPPGNIWEGSTPPLQSNRSGWHANAGSPLARSFPQQAPETMPSPLSFSPTWVPQHRHQQSLNSFPLAQPPQFAAPSNNIYLNQTSVYGVGAPMNASPQHNNHFGLPQPLASLPNQIPFASGSVEESSAIVSGSHGSPAFVVRNSPWR
ncbi:hypothetical protein BS47DRAFT_1381709 [Hydnum rufescens UP504]|uniref:Protein SMG7 n=1 Tax=Hydnum rufescens UP504 TaxID=1448309 RepID=A0A9P6DXN5_9AGAM|nr:hypothetical protein BS47DRAFT_1381709 [Hydnum rufescens UP504]